MDLDPTSKRQCLARAAAACLLAVLAGPSPAGAEAAAPTGVPVRGGTVVIAIGSDVQSLLPYSTTTGVNSEVQGFLYMTLANTEPDFLTFSPSLAKSWDWSPDHKTLTMHLRDDVRWSDGVPVTAEDVQFTWEVARDSLVGWVSRDWKQPVKNCEVVAPYTVRYRFDEVYSDQFRDAKEGMLLPKHLLRDVARDKWAAADFGRHPVGCGPFRLESWEPQQRIVLVRNELYYDQPRPYLDRIVFEIVPDAASRLAQLRAGRVDLVEQVAGRDAAEIRRDFEAGRAAVRIVSFRGRLYDFIGYNRRDPLFASRKVREALTRAIDRRAIIDGLCYGFAEPFESPIVPILWAYNPQQPITPYDPQGAARLLAEEGWLDTDRDGWLDKDGKTFAFTVMTNQDNQLRVDALVPIQRYWKAVGVKADIRTLEMQTAINMRTARNFQAYYGGWRARVNADLETLWGCAHVNDKFNFTSYCNPRVDSLNAAGVRLPPEEARPLFHEAQRLVAQDYPYTWMYYIHDIVALNQRVRGAVMDQRGPYNNPEEWWIPVELQGPGAKR